MTQERLEEMKKAHEVGAHVPIGELISALEESQQTLTHWDKSIAKLLPHLTRCEFDDGCEFCDDPQLGVYVSLTHIPEDVTEANYYKCGKCVLEEYRKIFEADWNDEQKVERFIVQIFEAGGNLKDLVYFVYREKEKYYRVLDSNNVLSLAQFNLSSALEFILERIPKNDSSL